MHDRGMPFRLPDKRQVLEAVLLRLGEVVAQLAELAEETRAGATHAEAKPENDKDTRALEQSYLARGQAMRVEAIVEQMQVLRFLPLRELGSDDPIEPGALAALSSPAGTRCVFLAPHGGGTEVSVEGISVLVVTPASPMGQALLGRTEGDEIELRSRGALREYEIVAVR
jgi:hypothetical protein